MLNAIDARFDRQPQSFRAGRVRFRDFAAGVGALDDHPLRVRRESNEGGLGEMAGTAVFDEVGPFVEIGVDRFRELRRRHSHQLFTGALRNLVVHLFLEQRQTIGTGQAEAD